MPAREEVHRRSRIFDHVVEQEALFRNMGFGRDRGHDRVPSPQPAVVEKPAEYV